MKKYTPSYLIPIFFAVVSLFFVSCGNSRKLTYFSSINKDSTITLQAQAMQTVIAKNDILNINISTLDDNITRNLNAVATAGTSVAGTIAGYLVDDAGMIKVPLLGSIKAEGYTKRQLEDIITNLLLEKKLAKEPVVVIRISNYKITVLGEVTRPGNISVPNEKITLPEALGQAGDLTPFGRRDSVLLIREEGGKRIYKRFSLNKAEMFDPAIYNLRNQDIIYVAPSKERAESTDRTIQYTSIGISIVSLIILVYVQLIK